ncbi:MAG TPA: hypothetical protein VGU64_12775 [Terriglobales bacterium]|jgi:hypothetical protein|nr:hypothetical protein [Terriglobales bacterium]
MKNVKPIGPAQIEQSTDIDHRANIHELTYKTDAFRPENNNDEMSANNLDALLRRVSEASTREIENLMGELHGLRNKLHSDGNRIQGDIIKYTELSQGILQLATIVSDSVKKLPGASDIRERPPK